MTSRDINDVFKSVLELNNPSDLQKGIETAHSTLSVDTPLAGAVKSMFSRLEKYLDSMPPGSVRVVIFGGCAVHLLTQARGSQDVDAELMASHLLNKSELMAELKVPVDYLAGDDYETLVYDFNYSNTLGPLHEDYLDRAISLQGFSNDRALQISVASGVDVAISKLDRFTDRDRSDIELLIKSKRVDPRQLLKLGSEAIDYMAAGNKSMVMINLKEVVEPFIEEALNESPKI